MNENFKKRESVAEVEEGNSLQPKFDENNLSLVASASELRKDYETLYNQLRNEIYPKKERKK